MWISFESGLINVLLVGSSHENGMYSELLFCRTLDIMNAPWGG